MAPRDHGRRWIAISMTLVAIVATVALVDAQRGSDPNVDTGPATGSTSTPTVLGEVITRSSLPEAEPATPATLARRGTPSSPTTVGSSPTTKPSKPRSSTTVPPPELIPPVTIENTTTTTEPSPTTTASTTTSTLAP